MAYKGKNPFKVTRALQLIGGVRIATLAGNETWTRANSQVGFLDAGGSARTITLPAEEDNEGQVYWVTNTSDAAEDIVLQNDASATVITISQNESGIVGCDGSAWDGYIITGALT